GNSPPSPNRRPHASPTRARGSAAPAPQAATHAGRKGGGRHTTHASRNTIPASPASRNDCLTSAAPTASAPAATSAARRPLLSAATRHRTDADAGTAASSSAGVYTA